MWFMCPVSTVCSWNDETDAALPPGLDESQSSLGLLVNISLNDGLEHVLPNVASVLTEGAVKRPFICMVQHGILFITRLQNWPPE